MAEMTASEAAKLLRDNYIQCRTISGQKMLDISALIERQAAEIERLTEDKKINYCCDLMATVVRDLQSCFDAKENVKWQDTKVIADMMRQQQREIAKKDRMLGKALEQMGKTNECPIPRPEDSIGNCNFPRNEYKDIYTACAACWLAWLEKEAEVQG